MCKGGCWVVFHGQFLAVYGQSYLFPLLSLLISCPQPFFLSLTCYILTFHYSMLLITYFVFDCFLNISNTLVLLSQIYPKLLKILLQKQHCIGLDILSQQFFSLSCLDVLSIFIDIFSRFLLVTRIMDTEDSSSTVFQEDQEVIEVDEFEGIQMDEEVEAATTASSSTNTDSTKSAAWKHFVRTKDDKGYFGQCLYCR